MNIDERLEALTQSVELLAAMHQDNEKRMVEQGERLERAISRMSERNRRLEDFVTQIAEGTARLLHTVEAHEQRLSDLEDNPQQ